jgi:hypothetical protein
MTDRPLRHDPVANAGDAFAAEAARRLDFLTTPAPMLGGSLDVLRGDQRMFDPMRLTVANTAAHSEALASDVAAESGFGDQAPAAPALVELFGVDLGTLTIAQLMQIMMECGAEMMQRQQQAAAGARSHAPPTVGV